MIAISSVSGGRKGPLLSPLVFHLTVCLLPIAGRPSATAQERPNVVLVVADDQAASDYGFMGHAVVRTPHLDRLATRGMVFKRGCVTSSLCCPSLASILTGLYPHQTGIVSNDPPKPPGVRPANLRTDVAYQAERIRMHALAAKAPMLPRILAANGYWCLQTGKWWHGSYSTGGFTHGMTHGDPMRGGRHGDVGLEIGRKTMAPIFDFVRDAKRQSKPFFVWYAPMMPHQPHVPPERLMAKYRDKTPSPLVARYWAMIEWFDESCGQLFDFLEAEGLAKNTVVLFLSDNGWIQNPNEPKPMRSKLTQYDAGHRTPIVVAWPGRAPTGRSDQPVSSIDLVPTILAAVGLKSKVALPGVNLLDGQAVAARQAVFGECFTHDAVDIDNPKSSLRFRWALNERWRLIVPDPRNEPGERPQLFDVVADPGESNDQSMAQPERVAILRRMLDAWWPTD